MKARIRLGVVTDEFFDTQLGRMGGFGWAARQLSIVVGRNPSLGIDLVYLASQLPATNERAETETQGRRVLLRRSTRIANMAAAWRERLDLILTVDYNLSHSVWIRSLPRTPCIVWVRDPRTAADADKIHTLQIPGQLAKTPQGLHCYDGHSMQRIVRDSGYLGRKLLFATPAPHLSEKLEGTYGFEPWDLRLLPNPILLRPSNVVKSARPSVVFLGRLDPIKRPWIFAALARRFPDVDFHVLGQQHFSGPGIWSPADLSPNVNLFGHASEQEKIRILSAAWVTVNTSIHEALAISLLESLACETPLLACQNPGFVVSRYGIYTGRFDGDGMDSLDAFSQGLRTLLDSPAKRREYGQAGRQWIESVHCESNFLDRFQALLRQAGVRE